MAQDALDSVPAYNRLSLRAVIVPAGQDPSAALAAAGILDPISLPVAITSSPEEAAQLLGVSMTPHLAAVLEYAHEVVEAPGEIGPLQADPPNKVSSLQDAAPPVQLAAGGFECQGLGSIGCQAGGNYGMTGMYQGGGRILCDQCARLYTGVGD